MGRIVGIEYMEHPERGRCLTVRLFRYIEIVFRDYYRSRNILGEWNVSAGSFNYHDPRFMLLYTWSGFIGFGRYSVALHWGCCFGG